MVCLLWSVHIQFNKSAKCISADEIIVAKCPECSVPVEIMLEHSPLLLLHHISFPFDSRKGYLGIAWTPIYLQHTRSTLYNHRNCVHKCLHPVYNFRALFRLADNTRCIPRQSTQTSNWPKTSFLVSKLLQDVHFRTRIRI